LLTKKKTVPLKISLFLVISIFITFGVVGCGAVEEEPVEEETLALLSTTDVHQYLLPYNYMEDEEDETIGLSKTYTLIEEAREEYDYHLLLDAGDLIQGSLVGVYESQVEPLEEGETQTIVEIYNEIGYDAVAIGNHEVQDYGLWFLDRAIEGAEFPWLSANMVQADNPDEFYTKPYEILEKDIGGQTLEVGVISFVPPQIMQWGRSHLKGEVKAREILDMAEKYLPELEAKTDLLVVNMHSGIDDSPPDSYDARENAGYYVARMDEVDALITGHQHLEMPNEYFADMEGVDMDAGTVHGVPTVMPGSWGDHLGILELDLYYADGEWGIEGHDVKLREVDEDVESHPLVEEMAADIHEKTLEYVRTPIGETEMELNTYFARIKDNPVVQLVNDAQLWYGEKQLEGSEYEELPLLSAAAPFVAGREGPDYYTRVSGEITIGDVTDIYLYDNTVYILKLDGQQVIDWLEHSGKAFNQIAPDETDEQHLVNYERRAFNFDVLEGVEYSYDLTQPQGERVVEATYQGEPLDEEMEFAVITNDYRAGGGGDFPHMSDDNVIFQSADVNREQIIYYIEEKGSIRPEPSFNWKLAPLTAEGQLLFRSNPAAGDYAGSRGLEGTEKLEVDEDGWGIFEIDLDKLN